MMPMGIGYPTGAESPTSIGGAAADAPAGPAAPPLGGMGAKMLARQKAADSIGMPKAGGNYNPMRQEISQNLMMLSDQEMETLKMAMTPDVVAVVGKILGPEFTDLLPMMLNANKMSNMSMASAMPASSAAPNVPAPGGGMMTQGSPLPPTPRI